MAERLVDVVVRRTEAATFTVAEAAAAIGAMRGATVARQDGDNLLVRATRTAVRALRRKLPGWILAVQDGPVPEPMVREKVLRPA